VFSFIQWVSDSKDTGKEDHVGRADTRTLEGLGKVGRGLLDDVLTGRVRVGV
jgi:hypothetical protein